MVQQDSGDLERVDNTTQQESADRAQAPEPSVAGGEQRKPRSLWWMARISFVLSLVTFATFPCICGYFSWDALPFAATSFLTACCGWVFSKDKFPRRIWHILAVILAALLLFDVLADILWFGHHHVLTW